MGFNKYLANITLAARLQLANRAQLIGRIILYMMIVYLFFQIFQSVKAGPNRVWYVAVTEWIMLSTPPLALQIEQDIRNGQIAYFLLRPMNYLSLRFTEAFGGFIIRYVILGMLCLFLGFVLTRTIPNPLSSWCFGIMIGFMGIILYSLILTLIGIFSFWIKEIHPILYLNLTATFCFGGLIVPLSFYSESFRQICFLTPYPWILSWPAETMTGMMTWQNHLYALGGWFFWVCLLTLLIHILYRRTMHSFIVEGG
jgi:ABC-2 type transport system permease protein